MDMYNGHALDETKPKRSSMLAYVPVHRRAENTDGAWRKEDDDHRQGRFRQSFAATDGPPSSRNSFDLPDSRRSSHNYAWSRNRHSHGSAALEEEDSDVSIPSTPSARFSHYQSADFSKRHSTLDRLNVMLEDFSHQSTHDASTVPRDDFDNLLRQYDRYDDPTDEASKRKSRRSSRIMDPFSEPTAEILAVDEPTVILDCYDFPAAFKTHHLHDIFREFEHVRGGYRIKWLGDTRALIIFDHPATAKKAYIDNVANPLAKIRPYAGPTDFLKPGTGNNQPGRRSFADKRASFNRPTMIAEHAM